MGNTSLLLNSQSLLRDAKLISCWFLRSAKGGYIRSLFLKFENNSDTRFDVQTSKGEYRKPRRASWSFTRNHQMFKKYSSASSGFIKSARIKTCYGSSLAFFPFTPFFLKTEWFTQELSWVLTQHHPRIIQWSNQISFYSTHFFMKCNAMAFPTWARARCLNFTLLACAWIVHG